MNNNVTGIIISYMLLSSEDHMIQRVKGRGHKISDQIKLCSKSCNGKIYTVIEKNTSEFCNFTYQLPCLICDPRVICKHSEYLEDYRFTTKKGKYCNNCRCNCACIEYIREKSGKIFCKECAYNPQFLQKYFETQPRFL